MQPVQITRSKEELLRQYDCLFQIDNHNNKRQYGGAFLGVAIVTFFTLLLYLFTPAPSLMVLKAISLFLSAFLLLFALPIALWLVIKRTKAKRDIRKTVEAELASGKQYYMSFSEEGLVFGSEDFKAEFNWSHYFSYLETPTVILLFAKRATYDFTSFSAYEIGADNLEQLKTIVRGKLPLLLIGS